MRGLALQLVNDILETLLSPVEKAKQPDEIRLEVDLAKVIKQAWDEQVVAALDQAIRLLRAGKGFLTPDDVNAVLIVLETMLGPGLAALTQEDLLRFVTSAYLLGRRKTIKTLGVAPNWAQIDDWSISVSQRHGVYWLQTYYTRELGQQVASTTEDLVFKQGLGRMDLARELQARLGNEWWAQGYQYWDVLASAVIQRTRNLANVNTLEAAGATTYEILAMMDERTCPICSRLDGKRFEVSQAVQLRDRILAAQSPEDVKTISPWITATKENLAILDRGDPKEIVSRGWHLPPFHGRCRCTVVVSGFKVETPKTYDEVLAEKENEIAKLADHERAYLLDERGNVLLGKDGEASSVRFTKEELEKFTGRILTHNHPRGTSLSPDDVRLACYYNLKEIRAVGVGQQYVYSMRPPDSGWSADLWNETIELEVVRASDDVAREFWARIQAGVMTRKEADLLHYHEVWTRVAGKTGLRYERRER